MNDLNERLQAVQEQRARRDRLAGLLARAQERCAEQAARLDELRATLAKERKDVERLEGLSLTALFHTVLSSKTEQLEKERQELLRATLQHDECVAAVDALEADIGRLRRDLETLADVDGEHARLVAEKERILLEQGGDRARRLFELGDEIAAARAKARELREAKEVGALAFDSLQAVIDSLASATGWGTWDLLGGGLISTAIKHSHIDKSRAHAREAQDDLRRFESELADVEVSEFLELEIANFHTFADYFLDGLIFDWVVQSKIHRSREAAVRVQRRVCRLLRALDGEIATVERRLADLESERHRAIEGG